MPSNILLSISKICVVFSSQWAVILHTSDHLKSASFGSAWSNGYRYLGVVFLHFWCDNGWLRSDNHVTLFKNTASLQPLFSMPNETPASIVLMITIISLSTSFHSNLSLQSTQSSVSTPGPYFRHCVLILSPSGRFDLQTHYSVQMKVNSNASLTSTPSHEGSCPVWAVFTHRR